MASAGAARSDATSRTTSSSLLWARTKAARSSGARSRALLNSARICFQLDELTIRPHHGAHGTAKLWPAPQSRFHGDGRDAESGRYIVARQSSEEAQLHQAALSSIECGQPRESSVQRGDVEVLGLDRNVDVEQGTRWPAPRLAAPWARA
jgi:hypothetical protein